MQGWLKPKAASRYCGIGERTFRKLLKNGLRHSRLPSGSILVKTEWLDEFLSGFEVIENEIDKFVDEITKEMEI